MRYTYDAAGDVLNDGIHTYSYDDEGRIITASLVSGGTESYAYDAEGQRIRKTDGTTPIEYIYDKDGRQVGEMASNGNLDRMEIYAGSRHLATVDGVLNQTYFSHSDWLGSERVRTIYDGSVYQTCTNLPYGDNQSCSAPPNGAPDPTPLHYTGKERDAESELDYFGARYYGSSMGRFMSPDWSAKATPVPYAKLDHPQSLNLYAYVGNNPLSHMDPDGHIDCSGKNAQGAGCQAIAQWNKDHRITPGAKKSNFPGVPVKLPNGNTVPDPHSPTGVMMAPTSSLSDVAAAGKKAGQDAQILDSQSVGGAVFTVELGRAVGTGGQFDDQRMGPQSDVIVGGFMQLPQFRDVSNFNVGLFSQQAGMTLDQTLQTAGDFAKHFSSNYSPNSPYGLAPQTAEFIRIGWQAGATQS